MFHPWERFWVDITYAAYIFEGHMRMRLRKVFLVKCIIMVVSRYLLVI